MVIRLKAAKAPAVVRSICTPRLHTFILHPALWHQCALNVSHMCATVTVKFSRSFGTRSSRCALLRVNWERSLVVILEVNPHFNAPNLHYTFKINSKKNFLPKDIAVVLGFLDIPSDKALCPWLICAHAHMDHTEVGYGCGCKAPPLICAR